MPRSDATAERHPGRAALAEIDRILAARPARDGHALTAAVQGLAGFRDDAIARHRRDGGPRWRPTLERVNAVISVVIAAEFPIGEVPWGDLEKARGWLADILRDEDPQ